ncbi:MAG: hypothetical protein JWN60_1329 [Acidobacteria bacterium]|jgi:ketosteroid isomerase-like protein|nr:hypothetical protein [Acidobacteriota bacterium]
MKPLAALIVAFVVFVHVNAQTKTDLQKLVETEIAFAKAAEAKGTKAAFLEFLSDEGVIFQPTEMNGKSYWKNQPESAALLSWRPTRADISSDGNLGYTTGGWELRPNGKIGKATNFGQYATVWQKLPDGTFKAVLDIGVSFDKSALKTAWDAPKDAGTGEKNPKSQVDMGTLTDIFSKKQLASGYFNYLAEDVIVLRDNSQPFRGQKQAFIELEKIDKNFPPEGFLNFSANVSKNYGNMMYSWGVYQLTLKDNSVKKWNFMQVWKFRDKKWQIVLDVLTAVKN